MEVKIKVYMCVCVVRGLVVCSRGSHLVDGGRRRRCLSELKAESCEVRTVCLFGLSTMLELDSGGWRTKCNSIY